MDLVSCVDCNEYAADLCSCPECQIPLGNVSSPDGDVVTLLAAHCEECTCEVVYVVPEFRICTCVV